MLFQFHRLGCKNVDALLGNVSRHYAKAAFKTRRRKDKVYDNNEVKDTKDRIPIVKCKKSMYNYYRGDRYPGKYDKLQLASHGWNNRKTRGDHFFIYPYETDIQENTESDFETFEDFNLEPTLCTNLENLGIDKPLEVQQLGIPTIFEGYNTVLAAETGCGKTLTYLLPMINKILEWKKNVTRDMNCPLGLIVTPSRELTVQIALELMRVAKSLNIKTKIITGGRTIRMILDPPAADVDILVCSFGVISKLTTFGVYNLKFVRFVVLDEADSLFHTTFEEKLRVFMRRLPIGYSQKSSPDTFPNSAQLILASATIPTRMESVLGDIVNLDSLEHIKTKKLHKILVPQKFMRLIPSEKPVELLKYVKPKVLNKQHVIIFSNRNDTSYWVSQFLRECGVPATNLHGDMPFHVRRGKFGEFINGKTLVLSTTNGGSRGLDTLMVNHILNYEFPLDTSAYIHRCGRTGRIGTSGESRVTNFISRRGEVAVVQKIERSARKLKPIPIFNLTYNEEEIEELENESNDYTEPPIENVDDPENIPY